LSSSSLLSMFIRHFSMCVSNSSELILKLTILRNSWARSRWIKLR
jgi:hypothetical protein